LSARPQDATGRPYVYPLGETDRQRLPRFCLARQPWFKVPCCPPNVAMTMASLGEFIYAQSDQAVYVNLYVGGEARLTLGGTPVRLTQKTGYPWDGRVKITVEPAESRAFDLCLRIPDWCRGLESTGGLYRLERPIGARPVRVNVNGERIDPDDLDRGYLRLRRQWRPGDVVELALPMPVVRITSHPKVTANAGRVALQRGPVVYCVEAVDHGGTVGGLWLPSDAELDAEYRPDLLGGVVVLKGTAMRLDEDGAASRPVPFLAVPYATWSNRQPGETDVWLPQGPPD
jgi:DUF1680 family protein